MRPLLKARTYKIERLESQLVAKADDNLLTSLVSKLGSHILSINKPLISPPAATKQHLYGHRQRSKTKSFVMIHLHAEEDLTWLISLIYHWEKRKGSTTSE